MAINIKTRLPSSLCLDELKIFDELSAKLASSFVASATKSHNFSLRETSKLPHSALSPGRDPERILSVAEFVLPKTNNTTLNELPESNQNISIRENAKISPWKRLALVLKSLKLLRRTEVIQINNLKILNSAVLDSLSSPINREAQGGLMYITAGAKARDALKNSREQAHFFKAIERGSEKDVEYIRDRLTHDPKMYCYAEDDPSRLPNQADHRGFTPLYAACKNGNMNMVKLLLQFKANPQQDAVIVKRGRESILTVAARWNHVDIVRFLMGLDFSWPQSELKQAYKVTNNEQIREIVGSKLKKEKKGSKGCFGFLRRGNE